MSTLKIIPLYALKTLPLISIATKMDRMNPFLNGKMDQTRELIQQSLEKTTRHTPVVLSHMGKRNQINLAPLQAQISAL